MTITEIKNLCREYGIRPAKSKGQNFLIAEDVLGQIVQAADLGASDCVLEIGPGFGVLTEQLVNHCQKVLSVELDRHLAFFLKRKFKGQKNLEILEADILKVKNEELAKKLGVVNYKIVANIPYSITKPILQKFLTYDPKPREMVLLMQKEVAQKIVARPGDMSLLSLSVQFFSRPEIIGLVAKSSFYPAPAVDSAILKIKILNQPFPAEFGQILSAEKQADFQEKKFWQLVKIGFSSPRKQLHNNLANGLKLDSLGVKKILLKIGQKEDCRAESLSLADWARLYQQFMV